MPNLFLNVTFLALLAACPALFGQRTGNPAQPRQAQLSGSLADISGAVIPGVTIQLRSVAGALLHTTQSDATGRFRFAALPPGDYRLIASSPGFAANEVQVSLIPSGTSLHLLLTVAKVTTSVDVQGRADDLLGVADSATQGTVGAEEIRDRPILRAGEILETVPGLIVTQHAGGGKANQYFLRGFNLDHGTDFALFLDGMPLNLPSHAHGEGYSDMNTVIPEFVQRVNFQKGPYYADIGNYGAAGSVHLQFFKHLPRNFLQSEGGRYGFGRSVFGVSQKLKSGTLLYGGEAYFDNGPWLHPDHYLKLNSLITYSRGPDDNGFSLTARGYHGGWNSSDQIPSDAIPLTGLFGTLNPTDGGRSQRYSLQAEWHYRTAHSVTGIAAYGFFYQLTLFSDFTYFLTDPTLGDQFEQRDRRWVAGLNAHHTLYNRWFGRPIQNTVGLQLRNDWIHNGLFQTQDRLQAAKYDSATGTTLPATTQSDRLNDLQPGIYAENKIQWSLHLRSVLSLRGDVEHFAVHSLVTAANSGTATRVLPSPKAGLTFGPWASTELYAQAGFSFHSNDGRGATQTVQPISADNPYPNTPVARIPALVPAKGGEAGIRTLAIPHLQTTASLWYLHSASELQQNGDTGTTVASQQPSQRYGIEVANYYTPTLHLALDFDFAQSRALFTSIDPADAAPNSPGGRRVPEAVGLVLSSGITLHDLKGFTSSLRLRLFGPRDLTSDSLQRSQSTALLNAELGYRFNERWRLATQLLNLLNRKDHDIDYAYTSRIAPSASPAFTDIFHPVEPFQLRFALTRTF